MTLTEHLVAFTRELRAAGLAVAPETTNDMVDAIDVVGMARRDDLHDALRAVATTRSGDFGAFAEVFDRYFGLLEPPPARQPADLLDVNRPLRVSAPLIAGRDAAGDGAGEAKERMGASTHEVLAARDFGELDEEEREELRSLMARMRWRPAPTRSRRWQADPTGGRPDLRRSLRGAVRPEGDLLPLVMLRRKVRLRPLIVIADVSGSMEAYTEMFLHFVHAAQGELGRVESFVFATHLTRITHEMRAKSAAVALSRVGHQVTDWSGGTKIGQSLESFNHDWSRRVTRGGAVALIISDGWDTGEPEKLAEQMALLSRSVHRVVWLNPLASRPGFRPETRGMKAALPYVDHFLAAASVLDLREVIRLLESVPEQEVR